jgi:hypothetical protein
LQAFNDEVLDLDHATFARECAIDIPGEETEALGKIAKEYNAFIMAQAKARHPDLKDRYFNVGFIINPRGRVILKHYKVSPLFPVEHSVCPHDVYDWWVEKYGKTLDAFWPVVDTEIGRMGIMMANEGSYPENARALALNGAEVVYRASYPHPATGNEIFEIQSRARALDNNMYLVAPNMGHVLPVPRGDDADRHVRRALVCHRLQGPHRRPPGLRRGLDLRRRRHRHRGLRDHRARAQWDNWMKDLQDRALPAPLREADLPEEPLSQAAPMKHASIREKVIRRQIRLMHDRDIWKRPDAMIAFDYAHLGRGPAARLRLAQPVRAGPAARGRRRRSSAAARVHATGLRDRRGLRHRRLARRPRFSVELDAHLRSTPARSTSPARVAATSAARSTTARPSIAIPVGGGAPDPRRPRRRYFYGPLCQSAGGRDAARGASCSYRRPSIASAGSARSTG